MHIEETRRDMEALTKSIELGKEKEAAVKMELARRYENYSEALKKQIWETERRRRAEREKEQQDIQDIRDIQLQFKRLLAQETERLYAEFAEEFQ